MKFRTPWAPTESFSKAISRFISPRPNGTFYTSTRPIHSHRVFSKYQQFTHSNKLFAWSSYASTSTSTPKSDPPTSESPDSPQSSVAVNEVLGQIMDIEERQKCRSVVNAILLDPRSK